MTITTRKQFSSSQRCHDVMALLKIHGRDDDQRGKRTESGGKALLNPVHKNAIRIQVFL